MLRWYGFLTRQLSNPKKNLGLGEVMSKILHLGWLGTAEESNPGRREPQLSFP